MNIAEKVVWVTHEFAGFHRWPDAPNVVSYLGFTHRHLFKVKAEVLVDHTERQVEFHLLKDDLIKACYNLNTDKKCTLSCENMALNIANELDNKYFVFSVSVSEDGECGAIIYFGNKER